MTKAGGSALGRGAPRSPRCLRRPPRGPQKPGSPCGRFELGSMPSAFGRGGADGPAVVSSTVNSDRAEAGVMVVATWKRWQINAKKIRARFSCPPPLPPFSPPFTPPATDRQRRLSRLGSGLRCGCSRRDWEPRDPRGCPRLSEPSAASSRPNLQ